VRRTVARRVQQHRAADVLAGDLRAVGHYWK
jgi:hypothetical protein